MVKNQLDRREIREFERERDEAPQKQTKKEKFLPQNVTQKKKEKAARAHTHNKKKQFPRITNTRARAREREREREIERAGRDCWNCFLFCA